MAEYEVIEKGGPNPGGMLLAGILIGAAIGMLFAPRRGSETRQILRSRAMGAKGKTEEFIGKVKEATGRMKGEAERTAEDVTR